MTLAGLTLDELYTVMETCPCLVADELVKRWARGEIELIELKNGDTDEHQTEFDFDG